MELGTQGQRVGTISGTEPGVLAWLLWDALSLQVLQGLPAGGHQVPRGKGQPSIPRHTQGQGDAGEWVQAGQYTQHFFV